mmetsp:Transcript_75744/g.88102  ORF Transcript_75744/g.88102 Transcript_75744/m.88102 type:complete len:220 (+) Transcript_75744:28-687(+)|eukprot:CAMPEP_0176447452 /NCGR_PEP_ID=MMETSP0127-20121128/25042_1 /TAXON_ID=938130 /ORGANISM="Platyophrya macrostoma, Strain WH" /LENGTH=219 /DNA_ID=CAMNT_0017833905 /DNA_START=28 /DNA_END=687 /DNA_ORIENTATION=+
MEADLDDLLFKLILVGDAGVGKTSILLRYCKDQFADDYNVTVGVEFHSQVAMIDNDTEVQLQIWDTAGQESFRAIVRSFYKNASGIFIVYNITKRDTFESLSGWLDEARANCQEDAVFVLMGNQADREEDREVEYSEGERFMRENNMNFFFESSALNSQNIQIAFKEAAKLIFLNCMSKLSKTREAEARGGKKSQGGTVKLNEKPRDTSNVPKDSGCSC